MTEQKQTLRSRLLRPSMWGAILFWLWNTIFISFMLFGFAPIILPELLIEVQGGFLPVRFLISGIILALIPVAATIVGFIWLRHDGAKLFALGYGVEAPLMMLFGLRFFVVRDLTWGMIFILSTAALGVLIFGTRLIRYAKQDTSSSPLSATAARSWFVGMSLLLVVGLYFIAWISFYVPPMAAFSWELIGEILWSFPSWSDLMNMSWAEFRFLPMMLLFIPLFLLTAGLFIALPIAVTTIYARAWWRTTKTAAHTTKPIWLTAGFTLIAAVWIGLFNLTNQQPQKNAFDALATAPTTSTDVSTLLDQEEEIKQGLLNAYLSPFRYLTAEGEATIIVDMYSDALYRSYQGTQIDEESRAQLIQLQNAHDTLARPLLYQPVHADSADTTRWGNQAFEVESAEAAELYRRYFDQPIVKGEKETIVDAVGQTWRTDMGRAAVQAVDDREVLLARQEINITEHGTWADVELYEVYANQTMEQQEVVYFFSLPESAVLTGVWLGNSDDRDERFVYRVSPRGAAQEVYQSQVRVRQDPALLEQIGPTQYRLRIFPIEARSRNWDNEWQRSTLEDGAPLHMWLTFSVLAENGAWPMPNLAEKFNIYWNNQSERLLNGETLDLDGEAWFPESVTAVNPTTSFPLRADLANGMSVVVEEPASLDSLSQDSRIAVVLDRSYSMADYADDVQNALSQLANFSADIYLTASEVHPANPQMVPVGSRELTQLQYFGGQRPSELLSQFYDLRGDAEYDAILILTDGAGYELGPAELELPASDTPLWFVHLGGQMPIGYDDDTLEAIQSSGGGSVGSVDQALSRMANQTADGSVQLVDGLLWKVMSTKEAPSVTINPDFAPFATRALILSEMIRQRQNLDQVEALDELHALAVENSIVTPYSSMIVLVTAAQERMLDELEKGEDRFDREYEEVGETESFNLTGVPEPHEWVLIGLSLLLGLWYWHNGRRQTAFA